MKPLLIPFFSLLVACGALTQTQVPPRIQLVQSVPVETNLAQPDIPFTQEIWIDLIRNAGSSIDMGQFYLSNAPGSALEPVIQELEKAGARGVKIRLLVSQLFVKNDLAAFNRFKAISNCEVRIYDISKLTDGILHAKYWLVDRKRVYVGSANFDWRALTHIHELGALVEDNELASQLTLLFEIDWEIAVDSKRPKLAVQAPSPVLSPVEMVASPPQFNPEGVRAALPALIELLSGAKKSIRFQLLEYSPVSREGTFWPDIDNALRAAAVRGVKVEVLVSDWNTGKPAIDHLKSLSLIPNVEIRIVSIPEYSGGYIPYARVAHSKYLIVDGSTFWLGTSNWSMNYFTASRNVELIFRQADLAAKANQIFEKLWMSGYVAKIDVTKEYIPPKKD